MPPVSPQGSRGLIAAVVILTICLVISVIVAIIYAVDDGKAEDLVKQINEKNAIYYGDTTSEPVQDLLAQVHSDQRLREKTVVAASIYNSQELEKRILGAAVPTTQPAQQTVEAADNAIAEANRAFPGVVVPDTSLVAALSTLTDYAKQQTVLATKAREDQSAAAANASAAIADATAKVQAQLDQNKKDLAEKTQSLTDLQTANAAYLEKLKENSAIMDKERQQFNDTLQKAQLASADLQKKIDNKDKELEKLTTKLTKLRVPVGDPLIRQPDGAILSIASDNIVYINLGKGDHIVPGLTFEVYNKHDGIPKLGDGMSDDNMPVGEASIEVQQVLANSSQCRVTKLEPGQRLGEGDLIANLVYDRNVKYNFVVYGKFDLSQTGHPSASDAATIATLIRQWGGKLQKDIDVDTDFVVMGSEPKVDDLPDSPDAFQTAQHEQQLADQKNYADQITKATNLHIPIMNQNRFLYFIGFYDLATR